jgi:hypothetical protein
MARPENPIPDEGPIADLARELRAIRWSAGNPPYRLLAARAHCGASALAEAAAGHRCPSWEVVLSYVLACTQQEAPEPYLRPLWEAARKADGRRPGRKPGRAERGKLATVRSLPRTGAGAGRDDQRRRRDGPDPWGASTPQEYVYQLRALRAWGGNPGVKAVRPGRDDYDGYPGWLSQSSFYDALNQARTTLPALPIVRALARVCGADVEQWTAAWRAMQLSEFEKANPRPVAGPPIPAEPATNVRRIKPAARRHRGAS